MARRLLVISFHFPPAQGVAPQRVGALVRELRALGWDVDVVSRAAAAPRRVVPAIQGLDWAAAIRGEARRRARRADVALLSGGPFAPFLLGPSLGIPYVLDFRDPWSWEPRFDRFRPGSRRRLALVLERAAERRAIHRAAAVVTVAPEIAAEYERLYPELRGKVHVVRHGFDPGDFAAPSPLTAGGASVLLHAGTMLAGDRTPELIVEAARRVRAGGRELRVVLLGAFSPELRSFVRDDWVEVRERASHADAIAAMRAADVLWLQPGDHSFLITGKIYEYLASRRPIVAAVRDDVSAAALLREVGGGVVVAPEPDAAAHGVVAALAGDVPRVDDSALERLAQPAIVKELSSLLESVT